jgi:hypothetical protein
MKYGKLTLLETYIKRPGSNRYGLCKCECGTMVEVLFYNLTSGNSKTCGCGKYLGNLKHGLHKHLLYGVWLTMRARCRNPKDQEYHNYGARGIKVCDGWQDAETFINWSKANGWEKGMSIERKDVNGNYCPENCTYIPLNQQNKNLRRSVRLEYDGEMYIIADLAKKVNMNVSTLRNRLKIGMPLMDAVRIKPSRNNPKFKYQMGVNGIS